MACDSPVAVAMTIRHMDSSDTSETMGNDVKRGRANGRETKTNILDAALAIWSEHGMELVTMQAVAERAGRSRGIMYHHFKSREDLIRSVQTHLDERLAHIFDFSKAQSRNDYVLVAGIMVDSPDLIRGFLSRLLVGEVREDPLIKVARKHYIEVEARNWLQPGMDRDHAAMISIAMWLASMLAVDLKTTEQERRAEAFRFADTFRRVMESSVILPEEERKLSEPAEASPDRPIGSV